MKTYRTRENARKSFKWTAEKLIEKMQYKTKGIVRNKTKTTAIHGRAYLSGEGKVGASRMQPFPSTANGAETREIKPLVLQASQSAPQE